MSPLMLAGVATIALCALFAAVYGWARRIDNYSIVDVAWSYAFGALALFYAVGGPGWAPRRTLMAAMVLVWSLRLGTHLWRRIRAHHPREDGRYGEMRRRWGPHLGVRMFGFFQLQAVSVVVLGLPFLLATGNAAPALHPLEIAGVALAIIALGGEALADAQLAACKRDPARRGRVCDAGLWRFSRHPNYFFEWLVWVGFFLLGATAPGGWLGLVAPLVILYLLLNVTGVPPTEEQLLRSKGDAYRRYQAATSAFVPWFVRTPVADATRAPGDRTTFTKPPP